MKITEAMVKMVKKVMKKPPSIYRADAINCLRDQLERAQTENRRNKIKARLRKWDADVD